MGNKQSQLPSFYPDKKYLDSDYSLNDLMDYYYVKTHNFDNDCNRYSRISNDQIYKEVLLDVIIKFRIQQLHLIHTNKMSSDTANDIEQNPYDTIMSVVKNHNIDIAKHILYNYTYNIIPDSKNRYVNEYDFSKKNAILILEFYKLYDIDINHNFKNSCYENLLDFAFKNEFKTLFIALMVHGAKIDSIYTNLNQWCKINKKEEMRNLLIRYKPIVIDNYKDITRHRYY